MRAILYLGTTTGVHYIIYDLSEINKHFLPDSALFYAEKYKKAHLHQKTDVLLQKTKKKRLDRKPGSVSNDDLSWPYVAVRLTPSPGRARLRIMSHTDVASSRVYIAAKSPVRW